MLRILEITQTSVVSNENSKYKCEISNGETYSLELRIKVLVIHIVIIIYKLFSEV